MNVRTLYHQNGKVEACLCGKCGRIWVSFESAERCCKCSYCGEFCDWRESVAHLACQDRALRESEAKALEKAELVEGYDGPFFWGDRFCLDVDELLERADGAELPEFGFCVAYQAPQLNYADIVENVASEMHEDWEPNDAPELEKAIELWNAANAQNGTYFEDRKRKWSRADLLRRASHSEEDTREKSKEEDRQQGELER